MITEEKYRQYIAAKAEQIAAENTKAVDELNESNKHREEVAARAIKMLESQKVDLDRCMSCFGRGYTESSFWGDQTGKTHKHPCKACNETGKVGR